MEIFQLDWILIDSVIILLLIFLLIGVRIFKYFSRWRLIPTDLNTRVQNIPIKNLDINMPFEILKFEKCKLIFHKDRTNKKTPLLIFCNSNFHKELLNILSEGFASFGFNVCNLSLKINESLKSILKSKNIIKKTKNEFYLYITQILDYFHHKNQLRPTDYFIIKLGKSDLPFDKLSEDPKNQGIVLLNPKSTSFLRNYSTIRSFRKRKRILLLFSRFPNFIFKLRASNHQLNAFSNDLSVIERKFYSFKNYETILFSTILSFIEKKK
ncbi:MAG: hypothetical protein EU547_01370 [Promethearchaeota archaeon]|nr:MAG: hypothetical protein EU547_01370 [Candidatus Lokiarchaeota archaeon]